MEEGRRSVSVIASAPYLASDGGRNSAPLAA